MWSYTALHSWLQNKSFKGSFLLLPVIHSWVQPFSSPRDYVEKGTAGSMGYRGEAKLWFNTFCHCSVFNPFLGRPSHMSLMGGFVEDKEHFLSFIIGIWDLLVCLLTRRTWLKMQDLAWPRKHMCRAWSDGPVVPGNIEEPAGSLLQQSKCTV